MQLDVNTVDGYNIVTALRGPDYQFRGGDEEALAESDTADDLKQVTTAVLRHFAELTNIPADVRSPEDAKAFWDRQSAGRHKTISEWAKANRHFMQHFVKALTVMCYDKRTVDAAVPYKDWFSLNVVNLALFS